MYSTQYNKVHLIAIGGSVMHNIAIALQTNGTKVSGSDDKIFDPARSALEKHGILPATGWYPEKITRDIDAVILGMHAKPDNPELLKAQELGIKVLSFPEFIYECSLHKQRVVIGGSHGKTSITAMIIHVLNYWNRDFDYVLGARLQEFDVTVKLSDAPVIIIEGDEYPSSILNTKPKLLEYHHHIGLISGIAWDHVNIFPSLDIYVNQFEKFADATPKAGTLIYSEDDNMASIIGNKERDDVTSIPYKTHPAKVENEQTILLNGDMEIPIQVFGKHTLQNISGAKAVLKRLGITESQFYEAIKTFKGASNRMELVMEKNSTKIFKDYAHSPSKVAATVEAFKAQYINKKLVACLELHTFSSLTKDFLKEYRGTYHTADIAIIYYNPENFEFKNLSSFNEQDVKNGFDRDDLVIFHDIELMKSYLKGLDWKGKNLLFMSSGDFNGLDIKSFSQEILE